MTRSQTVANPIHNRTLPNSKSLISRFTSPFSSKQRNPVEHEIRLDEPFRKYLSGDTVKGVVVLNTAKASRITHLVIRLHGFVKVVNNARLPGETIPYDENLLTSTKNRKGIEYFGNGFARLFEDERVLCGDGRIGGSYEFHFELDIPSRNMPSSIDFEHGTISYLLTSTLTRPTTISPTLVVHHKLTVIGTMDIARVQPPKPHIVSLEAVSKKSKNRIRVKRKSIGLQNGKGSISSSVDDNSINRMSSPSPQASEIPPQSPVPSVVSSASTGESTTSANNHLRTLVSAEASGSMENLGSVLPPEKTIIAMTELLQGGCLPGDTLPLRISIDHVRPIKTMQGLIITVFRQGRIDSHPALPISDRDGKRQYEDYYPKSLTGLGGLSLSSAGSSRVFRQDLAQTITPLIIDPHTLNAVIKTSIQMPADVFPTITCVPGGMISFKYYVEVVIDLRGKLGGQERFLPHLSITESPQHSYGDPKVSKIHGVDGVSYSATPGFNYLITDQIRRTKRVVYTTTEIIVGTRDSARSRGKQRESSNGSSQNGTAEPPQQKDDQQEFRGTSPMVPHETSHEENQPEWQHPPEGAPSSAQALIMPLPDLEEPHDEKSQIRRAEERLLPSSPPRDGEHSPAGVTPTAPFAYDEEDFVNRYGFGPPAPAYDRPSSSSPSRTIPSSPRPQRPQDAVPTSVEQAAGPHSDQRDSQWQSLQMLRSAPGVEYGNGAHAEPTDQSREVLQPSGSINDHRESSPGPSSFSSAPPRIPHPAPQEDKQELERQRLQAQASSPNDHPSAAGEAEPDSSAQHPGHIAPRAPTLDEVELARTNNEHDNEELPVYRR